MGAPMAKLQQLLQKIIILRSKRKSHPKSY
jgi:hypothetical protein